MDSLNTDMHSTDVFKQQSHDCAQVTKHLSVSLALAAILCVDAGSDTMEAAVALLVGSVAAAEMEHAYADLTHASPKGNMYDVQYTEPSAIALPHAYPTFESVMKDFTTDLLQAYLVLHQLYLSYGHLHAAIEMLESNRDDPAGALFSDAQMFSILQHQTLWRNLKLCTILHNDLLLRTAGVNVLWHQFRLHVAARARFSGHDVRETLTNIWRTEAQHIDAYHLNMFGISNEAGMLHILAEQKATFHDPVLLIQTDWHKHIYLLTQSFQHALDTFYTNNAQ
jgi:hypothetical protein